jgi:hypothetical protein
MRNLIAFSIAPILIGPFAFMVPTALTNAGAK